jgi:hypothetical protein
MFHDYHGGDLGPQYSNQEYKSGPSEKLSASGIFKTASGKTVEIRDVWASNLDQEMEIIRDLLEKYNYIAMDTEFPGIVAKPLGDVADMQYQVSTIFLPISSSPF